MKPLKVNNQNTVAFYKDYDYLLTTLINMEFRMIEYLDTLYYRHQIWSDESGWWLTFQVFDRETGKAFGNYDTKD